jgi:hypothetical protein
MTKAQLKEVAAINQTTPKRALMAIQLGEFLTKAKPVEFYTDGTPRVWRSEANDTYWFMSDYLDFLKSLERFYRGYLR